MTAALAFADPIFDAQRVFRAAMNALARPGSLQPIEAELTPPGAFPRELAALVLALADHETPLWLDAALAGSAEVIDYLRFHAGAPITAELDEAHFALVSDPALLPPLGRFATGTPEYPERSTTILIQADALHDDRGFTLSGPGIKGTSRLAVAGLDRAFADDWALNGAVFPLGVDVLFAAPGVLAGLPRTTAIGEG